MYIACALSSHLTLWNLYLEVPQTVPCRLQAMRHGRYEGSEGGGGGAILCQPSTLYLVTWRSALCPLRAQFWTDGAWPGVIDLLTALVGTRRTGHFEVDGTAMICSTRHMVTTVEETNLLPDISHWWGTLCINGAVGSGRGGGNGLGTDIISTPAV